MKYFFIFAVLTVGMTSFAQSQPKYPKIEIFKEVMHLKVNEARSLPVHDYEPVNGQQLQQSQSPVGRIYIHCNGSGTTQTWECQQGTGCASRLIELASGAAVTVGEMMFVCE